MSKISKKEKGIDLKINCKEGGKKQQNDKNDDLDDWKRLEKWQIGRRKFC